MIDEDYYGVIVPYNFEEMSGDAEEKGLCEYCHCIPFSSHPSLGGVFCEGVGCKDAYEKYAEDFVPERRIEVKYTTEYMFLKGALKAARLNRSLKAMSVMYELHGDQKRDDGQPYYIHPVKVANYLFTLLSDILPHEQLDICVSTALLHDAIEDCDNAYQIILESCGKEVADCVKILSKDKHPSPVDFDDTGAYYYNIEKDLFASIVKCSDRCHNVSTMAGVFNKSRLQKYVDETEKYVLPLIRHVRDKYPEISNPMVIMSYHIKSVIEAIKTMIPLMGD